MRSFALSLMLVPPYFALRWYRPMNLSRSQPSKESNNAVSSASTAKPAQLGTILAYFDGGHIFREYAPFAVRAENAQWQPRPLARLATVTQDKTPIRGGADGSKSSTVEPY